MAKKKSGRGERMGIKQEDPAPPFFSQPSPRSPMPPPATGPGPGTEQPDLSVILFGPPVPVGRTAAAPKPVAPRRAAAATFALAAVNPANFYKLDDLWNVVRSLRKEPTWRPPTGALLQELARPTGDPVQAALDVIRSFNPEVLKVYGITDMEVARHGANAWQYVIDPFMRKLEEAINLAKPADLPGQFAFRGDGSYGLWYFEQ